MRPTWERLSTEKVLDKWSPSILNKPISFENRNGTLSLYNELVHLHISPSTYGLMDQHRKHLSVLNFVLKEVFLFYHFNCVDSKNIGIPIELVILDKNAFYWNSTDNIFIFDTVTNIYKSGLFITKKYDRFMFRLLHLDFQTSFNTFKTITNLNFKWSFANELKTKKGESIPSSSNSTFFEPLNEFWWFHMKFNAEIHSAFQ